MAELFRLLQTYLVKQEFTSPFLKKKKQELQFPLLNKDKMKIFSKKYKLKMFLKKQELGFSVLLVGLLLLVR